MPSSSATTFAFMFGGAYPTRNFQSRTFRSTTDLITDPRLMHVAASNVRFYKKKIPSAANGPASLLSSCLSSLCSHGRPCVIQELGAHHVPRVSDHVPLIDATRCHYSRMHPSRRRRPTPTRNPRPRRRRPTPTRNPRPASNSQVLHLLKKITAV